MILDRNTAFYSLKLYGVGQQMKLTDGAGRSRTLEIVALLTNSVLQGNVLIGERRFLELYGEVAGRRSFLLRRGEHSPPTAELAALLESTLEEYACDAVDAQVRLGQLMAVQNTYLSTFQSLGGLGLLLGAAGLAVVQLRSVLERRGELALLQAVGFAPQRLTRLVLAENLTLLFGGLAIGVAAAALAVVPHALSERAAPPWKTLAAVLALTAAIGGAAAWLAARRMHKAPLLAALRGE